MRQKRQPLRLTPMMETALRTMKRGELERTPKGWVSDRAADGIWNTHTIGWLAQQGYCDINGTSASITQGGKVILNEIDQMWWAA